MPKTIIEVGAINIAASPHPTGIYELALKAVADKEVRIRGSDWAKITQPGPFEDNPDRLFGQILVWTEIDTKKPWLNKRNNSEATPEEKKGFVDAIPRHIEPNFRSFSYIFLVARHRLVLEYRNEFGDHFGPQSAEKLFRSLLSERFLPDDLPSFAVTIVPDDDTVDQILSIPRLNWIEIVLERPNADDIADASGRIQKQLEKWGAKTQKIEIAKAPKEKSLKLGARIRQLAIIASLNGKFSGRGKDEAGKRVDESTAKHPKTVTIPVEGTSTFAAFLSALKFFS